LHRARKKMTDVYETRCALIDDKNECTGCIVAARIQHKVGPKTQPRPTVARGGVPSSSASAGPIGAASVADAPVADRAEAPAEGTPPPAPTAPGRTCDQIDELLSDLLADELPHAARAGVETHLATCEMCAASYKAMKRTVRFVQAHANTPLVPGTPGGQYADFTRAMMDDDYDQEPIDVIAEAVFGRKGSAG
jgi:hypothetical protein